MANPIKVKAIVASIENFGEGTYLVRFQPEGLVPRYKPGQFLHLALDDYDPAGGFWPESRVFSIASAPDSTRLEIVYSVKGQYTRRMEERLCPGAQVWLKLPYGSFIINSALSPGQDAVLVAGGTGISPFLPYIAQRLDGCERIRTVRLYYGVRRNSQILAKGIIDRCAAAGLLEPRLFVENEEPTMAITDALRAFRGRLSIEQILNESIGLHKPVFFLSGPPMMITSFKEFLRSLYIEANRIMIDEWE